MTRLENARMRAHYFRTSPRLAVEAFIIGPIKRESICRFRGHLRGDTAFRLLGLCDRCLEEI